MIGYTDRVQKKISLEKEEVEYTLKVSPRARQMRLAIYQDGSFVVTMPRFLSERRVEKFIQEKSRWIVNTLARFRRQPAGLLVATKRGDYARHKEAARAIATERLQHFNREYGFRYGSISIRNQKTRWGSCSRRGNLSFNYKIALLPAHLADYVVLHELCHRGEFNHSARFWDLMSWAMPDFAERREELKRVRFGRA